MDHVEFRYTQGRHTPGDVLGRRIRTPGWRPLKLPHAATVPAIVLKNDNGFVLRDSVGLTDVARGAVDEKFKNAQIISLGN